MKFKIEEVKIKKEGEKNGKPWKITSMTLIDEHGVTTENVDTFDAVESGFFIEGEIEKGQYGLNFKKTPSAKQQAGANFKSQQIEKVMDKKADQIAQAQDRSAWMWAKNSACLLVAHHPAYRDEESPFAMVEELATKIYNSEPLTPFN
jgi:hypothetical protein